jgi:hypothetical protein
MGQVAERINNAISKLILEAGNAGANEPTMRAIKQLGTHWSDFWKSNERAFLPEPALLEKYERYVKWYTRAWCVAPARARELAPRPDSIDPRFEAVVADSVRNYTEGAQDAAKAGQDLAAYAADKANALYDVATKPMRDLLGGLGWVLIGAGVLYWAVSRKGA